MESIEENLEKFKEEIPTLPEIYEQINQLFTTYLDLPEEEKKILSLWAFAMNLKNAFPAVPYLFINASKGSGKSRLLKILEKIIPKSVLTPNLTEASLKRLPSQENLNALLIDEAENMSRKEKSTLKELLNQAYKQGGQVLMVEEIDGKKVVKKFPVFLGIALANIWGLESTLQDRCITIMLQKSKDPLITKIPEYFDLDERFDKVRKALLVYEVQCMIVCKLHTNTLFYTLLNKLIDTQPTLLTQPQLHTQPTLSFNNKEDENNSNFLVTAIIESSLFGRDMELWLPLLVVSFMIGENFFLKTLELAEKWTAEKQESEIMEDHDTIFSTFLYYYFKVNGIEEMIKIQKIYQKFVELEGEKDWFTNEWIGRCLKRINAIKSKRRLSKGVEIEINLPNVEKYLRIRGVELEENISLEYVEQQLTLKDRPDAEDRQEAREK